jgi:hypothetical protein
MDRLTAFLLEDGDCKGTNALTGRSEPAARLECKLGAPNIYR